MKVWLDDARVDVPATALLGQGGEADVYDLGDGRVLKLFKPPTHPDLVGLPDAAAAAAARLAEHQHKLPAFPPGLPARVVAPAALARRARRGELVGYAMPRVTGDALFHLGEPRWHRDHPGERPRLTAALAELGRTVARVHAAGVVIGDFNDLNVLVDGERAWLIDADSFQYGTWRCAVFTERLVDPRLCDPAAAAPALLRPHDRDSDWFAFAAMALRTLLGVGPWGGIHQPADPARRVAASARARRGVSIYDPDVRAPRAALPTSVLPDELDDAFRAVFVRGARGPFPLARLDDLSWRRCACGADHARAHCPVCRTTVAIARPAAAVRGALRVVPIDARELAPRSWTVGAAPAAGAPAVWLDGGMLYLAAAAARGAPELIGQVLAGHTRAWVGRRLGVGLYRAGGCTIVFAFRPDRRGLADSVTALRLRGQLVDAHAVVGDDRAWLFTREVLGGKDAITITVLDAAGRALAARVDPADEAPCGVGRGAVAAGPHLFAPTDAGVIRLTADGGAAAASATAPSAAPAAPASIDLTARFPDTAELVSADDELHLGPRGLDVRKPDGRAFRLEL